MELESRYCLSRHAAIRPERFGGLIYRHDNRCLYVVHSRALVDFVSGLDGTRPLAEALDSFLAARSLPETARPTVMQSLAQLVKMGVLDEL